MTIQVDTATFCGYFLYSLKCFIDFVYCDR